MFRSIVTIAAVGVAAMLAPDTAGANMADCSRKLERKANKHRNQVIKIHGKRSPGRDIIRHGVLFHYKRHSKGIVFRTTQGECHRYNRQLKKLIRAAPYPTLDRESVPPRQPPAGTQTAGWSAGATLDAIRQCESGGNYSTNTGNGFYGAYQFTLSTWASVGGSGNPAAASPAEQDMRAAMLYAREGPGPWPVCGQ